ncbi:MAG: GNAT family N-acetyltransferase [Promethearchaeota archaeon]
MISELFPAYFYKFKSKDECDVLIRPLTPNDENLILEFFYELSDETKYYRFLYWKSSISRKEVKQYTNIDYENNFTLGAVIEVKDKNGKLREKVIGVAQFFRDLTDYVVAEMAVVVIDEWQGKGCGSQLLKNLITIAKHKGIQWIIGLTLSQNDVVCNILKRFGHKIYIETSKGIISFKFRI